MEERHIPVRVLADCNADGAMIPLRFRLETPDHLLHTVHITRVISCREIQFVGVEGFIFLCKAVLESRERLFELRYTVRSHKWELLRTIS